MFILEECNTTAATLQHTTANEHLVCCWSCFPKYNSITVV